MKVKQEVQRAIVDYLNGSIDKAGAECLLSWVEENDDHRKYFNEIFSASISKGLYKGIPDVDESDVIALKKKINARGYKHAEQRILKIHLRTLLRIAAAVIFLMVSGSVLYLFLSDRMMPVKEGSYFEATAPDGSRSLITMSDSTTIWLNAGTKIKYNSGYGITNRDIYLEGEAYFQVRKGQEKPFIVYTSHTSIKALGTSFNIKSYPEENIIETTLEEGIVELEVLNTKRLPVKTAKLVLEPSQKALFNKQGFDSAGYAQQFIVENVGDLKAYTSWKDEKWIVKQEKMSLLASKLERRYNVEVVIRDEELKEYMITAVFEDESLEQVLHAMSLIMPLRYEVDRNQVYLYKDNELQKQYNRILTP